MIIPEAKAKVRKRQIGIRDYQSWLNRQEKEPTHRMKIEMFDFFIDQAMKKK